MTANGEPLATFRTNDPELCTVPVKAVPLAVALSVAVPAPVAFRLKSKVREAPAARSKPLNPLELADTTATELFDELSPFPRLTSVRSWAPAVTVMLAPTWRPTTVVAELTATATERLALGAGDD
jgi:hypothetical protein